MNSYNEENHEYFLNGIVVPSVTQIIPKKNFYMSAEQLEIYRKEGQENHELFKMYFDTCLPGQYTGKNRMIMALDRFIEKDPHKLGKLISHEEPMFSEKHRFAGTPDTIFEKGLIDFKRSRIVKKDMALQAAGYHILAVEKKIIKPSKIWVMAWYDDMKDEFISTEVWNAKAEETFLLYLKRYYIDKMIEQYYK